ncbi:hypothetical protein DJ533_09595 [Acinetobacter defluvii]|uniref:Uncharacterized protein n=1 Tax=Acinetobacter defluvii TaxID=1871111 RepID=A0A2S2FCW6_9GAMM|nr:hypothetical protein [Acinetobacter defluvii]AWL28804.1 hypothetical protein DJ533_09595 [Acinetobacter defluvii]
MTKNIYAIFQDIFPELKQQTLPEDLNEFSVFCDWLNQEHSFIQYVEIKEYYDNGIDESTMFQQKQVDTEALNQAIEETVDELFESLDEDQLEDYEAHFEIEEKIEEILFDQIKTFAEQKQLSLLVIFRENPYWLVVPSQDESQLQQIVDAFNQHFAQDMNLSMTVY